MLLVTPAVLSLLSPLVSSSAAFTPLTPLAPSLVAGRCVPVPNMAAPASYDVYSRLEMLVRRARTRSTGGLAELAANSISGQWLDKPPARLAEAVLVSGRLLLDSFDEGLDLLILAEEEGEASLSGAAYSALMRLGLVEDRYADVLALLARERARGSEITSGALLSAMKAADALGDWGAVARLFSLLSATSDGAEVDALSQEEALQDEALELELIRLDAPDDESADAAVRLPASVPTVLEAFSLALRAHCERGDVARALGVVEGLRERGRALPLDVYPQLALLARKTRTAKPLLSISLSDIFSTAAAEAEPLGNTVTNRIGLAAAGLGTVERTAVAAVLAFSAISALVSALDGLGVAPSPLEANLMLLDVAPSRSLP